VKFQYDPDQKKRAKEKNQKLVAVDAGGLEFSGPVTQEELMEVNEFLLGFLKRRAARLKAEAEEKAG
jgi:hypothetical protein